MARTMIDPVYEALLGRPDLKSAVRFFDSKFVIKVTRQQRPDGRSKNRGTLLLTIGAPNYRERQFIKRCKKEGRPLPESVQVHAYPRKRRAA